MHRTLALAATVLCFGTAAARAGDGYVGIYSDPGGTTPCTTVSQGTGITLYVIANIEGASANGVAGAEFRIEASNPTGWFLSYSAPSGSIALGSALDLEPSNPSDGSGINLAFADCQVGSSGKVALGTIGVFNVSGSATSLAVKRHSNPTNPAYACPLFVLCDSPTYSKLCMTIASEPACSLTKSLMLSSSDNAIFVAGLNTVVEGGGDEPGPPLPMWDDLLVRAPLLFANPVEPDIVGFDGDDSSLKARAILTDTIWKADYSFDGTAGACNLSGWQAKDNLVRHNGSYYWSINTSHAGAGNIVNRAAVLRGGEGDLCWSQPGYGNDWDFSIKLKYKGSNPTLQFDYLLGSESSWDFLTVEADSANVSNELVDYETRTRRDPSAFRDVLFTRSGTHTTEHVSLNLPNYGLPSMEHAIYVRFSSGPKNSDEDGTPNPFNPFTTIRFDLATEAHASLRVLTVSGHLIRTLVDANLPQQRHEVKWDGKDNAGRRVSSGVYFYRLDAGGQAFTRKLVVLK